MVCFAAEIMQQCLMSTIEGWGVPSGAGLQELQDCCSHRMAAPSKFCRSNVIMQAWVGSSHDIPELGSKGEDASPEVCKDRAA